MKIRIAELNIDIANRGRYIEKLSEKYIADFDAADINIKLSDADVQAELTATEYQITARLPPLTEKLVIAYRSLMHLFYTPLPLNTRTGELLFLQPPAQAKAVICKTG